LENEMKMTRKIALGLSLAATALAGGAFAQQAMKGDGVTTRAEVQERAQAMFARMDANHDGKLDQADRAARRDAVFDRIDADHNGQISRAEFETPRGPRGGEGAGAPGMRGPGGPESHRGHRMWGHRMGGGHRGGMMGPGMAPGMADANHDGTLTQAEFVGAAMQRFDRIDADHDGKVTRDERQAAFKAMREERRAHWRDRAGGPVAPQPPAN
jgi:hypothetical protein